MAAAPGRFVVLLSLAWAAAPALAELCTPIAAAEPIVQSLSGQRLKFVGAPSRVRVVTAPRGTRPTVTIRSYSEAPDVSTQGNKIVFARPNACDEAACPFAHADPATGAFSLTRHSDAISVSFGEDGTTATASAELQCAVGPTSNTTGAPGDSTIDPTPSVDDANASGAQPLKLSGLVLAASVATVAAAAQGTGGVPALASRLWMGGLAALVLSAMVGATDEACRPTMEVEIATQPFAFQEPQLPGVMMGVDRPKLLLAQDIDWPPYAYLGVPPESDFDVAGFGHDVAHAMGAQCGIDVTVMQTDWAECWDAGAIGMGLKSGYYHACMTYTHTVGERNRFLEFSLPILQANKPAGLLTRLVDGVPHVNGSSDLSGLTIVDVVGWAPTSDTLAIVGNPCTGGRFSDFTMLTPTGPEGSNPNDVALEMLLNGEADAMWVYADQAHNYHCGDGVTPQWNCTLWDGFGTTFAYVQTGLFDHVYNGTTLAMAKKGSGVKQIVDACLPSFLQTREYYDICERHELTATCFPNSHFPAGSNVVQTWEVATNDLTTTCSDGYCACPSQ